MQLTLISVLFSVTLFAAAVDTRVADAARRRGVLVRAIANKVVMSPPLTLRQDEAAFIAVTLREALQECCADSPAIA